MKKMLTFAVSLWMYGTSTFALVPEMPSWLEWTQGVFFLPQPITIGSRQVNVIELGQPTNNNRDSGPVNVGILSTKGSFESVGEIEWTYQFRKIGDQRSISITSNQNLLIQIDDKGQVLVEGVGRGYIIPLEKTPQFRVVEPKTPTEVRAASFIKLETPMEVVPGIEASVIRLEPFTQVYPGSFAEFGNLNNEGLWVSTGLRFPWMWTSINSIQALSIRTNKGYINVSPTHLTLESGQQIPVLALEPKVIGHTFQASQKIKMREIPKKFRTALKRIPRVY